MKGRSWVSPSSTAMGSWASSGLDKLFDEGEAALESVDWEFEMMMARKLDDF